MEKLDLGVWGRESTGVNELWTVEKELHWFERVYKLTSDDAEPENLRRSRRRHRRKAKMRASTRSAPSTPPTTAPILVLWLAEVGTGDSSDPSYGPVVLLPFDIEVGSGRVVNVCEPTCTITLVDTAVETNVWPDVVWVTKYVDNKDDFVIVSRWDASDARDEGELVLWAEELNAGSDPEAGSVLVAVVSCPSGKIVASGEDVSESWDVVVRGEGEADAVVSGSPVGLEIVLLVGEVEDVVSSGVVEVDVVTGLGAWQVVSNPEHKHPVANGRECLDKLGITSASTYPYGYAGRRWRRLPSMTKCKRERIAQYTVVESHTF
jgi:hypothetical protein